MGIVTLAASALMIAGMTAFASDASSIKDNKEYTAAINTAEVSIDALKAVGDSADGNFIHVQNASVLFKSSVKNNVKCTKEQIEKAKAEAVKTTSNKVAGIDINKVANVLKGWFGK